MEGSGRDRSGEAACACSEGSVKPAFLSSLRTAIPRLSTRSVW